MKRIFLSLALLLSASAFASETPDFLKRYQDRDHEIVDTMFKNYGEGEGFVPNVHVAARLSNGVVRTHFVSIMNACVTGESVSTINPIRSCQSYEYPVKECSEVKEFRQKWPGRALPRRLARKVCYDKTKQKVCEKFETVMASAPILTVKDRCVKKHEQAYKDWKKAIEKKYWMDKDKAEREIAKWEQDYPDCTIAANYNSFARTAYNFDIVENIDRYDDDGEKNDDYDWKVKGKLIMNVDVELPQCSGK